MLPPVHRSGRPRRSYKFSGYAWAFLRALLVGALVSSAQGAEKTSPPSADSPWPRAIDLSGSWQFAIGTPEPVFPIAGIPGSLVWSDTIELPGTTETRGKGPENPARELSMLTRVRKFDGPAWYQRVVEVPSDWADRHVILFLERTKYTQVWWDGKPLGEQRLLTVPQRYLVAPAITPGRHTVTVMVDNRAERRLYSADAHQYSDNTQTNWNGIIGRIELIAEPRVAVIDAQAFPDIAARTFELRLKVAKQTGAPADAKVEAIATSWNHNGSPHRPAPISQQVQLVDGDNAIVLTYPLGHDAKLWDEFSPALYRIRVLITSGGQTFERVIETALRQFGRNGTQLSINGRTVFLRGKHEGCVFPITGHPPMDVDGWIDHFRRCQEYGINHIRCHTWVPPEAAFAAADRLGIYLQPELPFWGSFDAKIRDALTPEAESLIREYGNHPSFAMMTLGNELSGDRAMMNEMVQHLRSLDPRHLYADGSNNVLWNPEAQPTNDFWSSAKAKTPKSGAHLVPARGSFYFMDGNDGVVQWGPASTRMDLREANEGVSVPLIGHEIGQYTVYPNYGEIAKYTGVVQARNLETFRDRLAARGMLNQANDFFRASGVLTASLYKEELELALRTPGFGGFQILDLQDFPGQGTALVGILDAFMDSKGLITADAWRDFCSPIVPLARFDRYVWTADETYSADIEVAHYGAADLRDAPVEWSIETPESEILAKGEFKSGTVAQGGLRAIGHLETSLKTAKTPARYNLHIVVIDGDHRYHNQWPLWVYPKKSDNTAAPEGVSIVRTYAAAKPLLAQGRAVLLIPEGTSAGYTMHGAYATDFWCWPMFNSSPGTMGLLCDPHHPGLAAFPTAFHSERQWSAIALASRPVILTEMPSDLRPIVQVVDNLARNEKIGLVFEGQVGERGKLLVCAADLYSLGNDAAARQFLTSLIQYAQSRNFDPHNVLPPEQLDRILGPSLAEGRPVTVSSLFKPSWGAVPKPESAVDDDINTRWASKEGDLTPWLAVDLGQKQTVKTVQLLWDLDSVYPYVIEGSDDGQSGWTVLAEETHPNVLSGRHTVSIPAGVRHDWQHVRVRATAVPAGKNISLRDLRIWNE